MSQHRRQRRSWPRCSKFDALAHEFWDPRGAFRPLHVLNPVRLDYVAQRCAARAARACSISVAAADCWPRRWRVTARKSRGIDLAPAMIEVARLHAHESQLAIDYRAVLGGATRARRAPRPFDVITCMELIEHVPEPGGILAAIASCCGRAVICSSPPSTAICAPSCSRSSGAEYLLRLIPRGTHEYARLVRPAELARLARARGSDADASQRHRIQSVRAKRAPERAISASTIWRIFAARMSGA